MPDGAAQILSLDDIRARVEKLAARIGASEALLPTYGHSDDGGRPHIERDTSYHFVVRERGQELQRRTTADLDQLLSWIFAAVTFGMAADFEVEHRHPSQDSRRLLFDKQLALLGALSPAWAEQKRRMQGDILAAHPFRDRGM